MLGGVHQGGFRGVRHRRGGDGVGGCHRVVGFPGNPVRNLTIRNLTMTMADDPACDFSANGDWVPPKTDAFRVPKSYTVGKAQGQLSV